RWQPGKTLGKNQLQKAEKRAAKIPAQGNEPWNGLAAGKHADEGRCLRLDPGDSVDQPGDEGLAVFSGADRIEPFARKPADAVLKLLDQRRDDIILALEELVDRADRDIGAFRDQIG